MPNRLERGGGRAWEKNKICYSYGYGYGYKWAEENWLMSFQWTKRSMATMHNKCPTG